MAQLKMDIAALDAFMAREFPQAARVATRIERLEPNRIRVRLPFHEDFLRPGGTLSGPTLMGLADRATYLLVLAMIGPVALAVTTSLNIHFLSKPEPRDLIADAQLAHAFLTALLIAALPPLGRARAQELERHPIVIQGQDEVASFSLRDRAGATLVERCNEPCRLTLPRGRFRLELYDPEGRALGARSVGVKQGAIWTAARQNTTKRDLGLGLGITGLILLNIGAVLVLTNVGAHGGQSDAQRTRAGLGLLMALGDAITTPIGWAMFFGNLRPRLQVQPLEPTPL